MAGTSQKSNTKRTSAASGQKTTPKKTTTNNKSTSTRSTASQSSSGARNAASRSNAGSRSTASRSSAGRTNTGSRSHGSTAQSGSSRTTPQKPRPQYESFLGSEIVILILVAVCVLLFLSNLGLCGALGQAIHGFLRGTFGVMGYVFPVYLVIAALFYQANRDNGKAVAKVAASAGVFLVFCGIAALLTTKKFDAATTIGDYYKQAADVLSGGAVGGMFLKVLCPTVGMIGGYVVTILLATIGIVFVTERSVLQPISKGSKKVYNTAKEDMVRRKEEHALKAEERSRYRREQKVSGVALDTVVGDGAEEATQVEASEFVEPGNTAGPTINGRPASTVAAVAEPTPTIQVRKTKTPQNSLEMEPLAPERPDAPVIPISGDIIMPKKDTRTLGELEALDSLHGNVFTQTRDKLVWKEPEEEKKEVHIPTDAGVQMHLRDIREEEKHQEQDLDIPSEPVIIRGNSTGVVYDAVESEAPFADVKRVTTSSGKVVEVELDPDDDPLTRKRMERRLAEQAAKRGETGQAGAKGSQGDTVALAGANGLGSYARPEPENPALRRGAPSSFEDFSELQRPKPMTQKSQIPGQQELGQYGAGTQATQFGDSAQIAAQAKRPPKPYVMPPLKLLKAGENKRRSSDRELRETARKLETTLQNFGVGVTVTNISCGPTVTRYELQPEQGVRVSKIVGLSDDIKLNLAAADIRIEAPIPGKASVGIEVPNKENATVFLRDVLESEAFTEHRSKLAFSVGQDISGGMVVTDLAKMPHLLIAGATGSGKSVCINTLIMSILYKAKPEEVRLIMVDPKVVELSVYNGIPHLMIPVVTDPKKAAGALNWAVAEMTDRYRKFADWNVRDLKGYNEKAKADAEKNGETFTALPQIVIIVDELADLMMVAPGDVEDAICRLAQMARAAGIHLVIATQRPSVNVITGLIKANVPSRIAFSVSSGVDSRTILDMNGAEKLLGKGDMLFYPSGYQKPVRVQGAFVSDAEVASVVEFVTKNNQGLTYDSAIEARLASMENGNAAGGADSGAGSQSSSQDEYLVEAGRFIIEKQKASIGMLQRVFKIGFNRAARIMDALADLGVVSEEAGTKAREILMDMNQYEQLIQELGL